MEPGNGDSIVLEEEIDQNYVPSEVTRERKRKKPI